MGYALKNVNSIESMLRYCNDSLKWNIAEDYFDDIDELTYDFTASDLGIKDEEFAKINTLKQMRPLYDNQDWAVFLVDFEGKRIDVTALRRVLNAIIPKRTNRDRMTWACDHIFFMCLWGEYSVRSVGFSAFEEYEKSLPVMKIIYCTPTIESTEGIRNFENKIAFLECERNESFIDRLKFWSQALRRRNQNIHSAQQLTETLASKAMKIAMKLKETGYEFPANSRLQVFLANSLIEGKHIVENKDDPLEIENALAESVRKDSKINVVIGSPPFHADSKNQNEWIMALMEDYKKEPGSTERLREKNPKLINDDYVKFIRLAEDIVKNQDNAVIAYIIPFSYASNLTFRGMRWNLLKQFSEIYILDLHGNVMGRDAADSAERDENILDIQLGVCVSFFIKKKDDNTDSAKVFYSDFSGSRERKYQFLLNAKFGDIQWTTVNPVEPYYFFKPVDLSQADEYNTGISLADLFPAYLGGVKTHDDGNHISFTSFNTGCDYLYDYRPFDIRHINYDRRKVSRDRYDIMRHMIGHENYGLVIDRQVVTDNWSHIQIVRHMIDNRLHYSNRGIPVLCPMYLYEDGKAKPNVNSEMVSMITEKTGISFSESLVESETEFDIMDLFDYSYGILNSPLYIEKYIDLLKIEFPKVPIPNGNEMFWRIVAYGRRLRKLHLLEEDIGNPMGISFEGVGDNIVSSRKLKPEGLYINRTQLFTNVTEEIWDFCYGGYHGLQKWFKDRNGMKLSEDDIQHVIRVLNVFEKTISIREDLDICMDEFGLI